MGKGHRLIDMTGKQCGHWTVIERGVEKHGHVHWLCRCVCGYEALVHGQGLRYGRSLSCGCQGLRDSPRGRAPHENENWTEAELDAIRRYYPINGAKCLKWVGDAQGTSPRSAMAIRAKAKRMGIKCERTICGRKDVWGEWEIDALRKYFPVGGTNACIPHVSKMRSKGAIKLKAESLGLHWEEHYWTAEEDAVVRKYYKRYGTKACAKRLGHRSDDSIRARARILGVQRPIAFWSPAEDAILKAFYSSGGTRAVRERLPKRTPIAVGTRARKLGLLYQPKMLEAA
jgi:hypothetical protein